MSTRFADDVVTDGIRDEGNFILALIAGLVAAVLGAVLWVGFTALTGEHVDYLAIVVSAVVGISVRFAGCGSHRIYGLVAAIFALAGSLGGELLSMVLVSTSGQFDFYGALTHLDPLQTLSSALQHASVWAYGIYAVSVIGAYRVAICTSQRP